MPFYCEEGIEQKVVTRTTYPINILDVINVILRLSQVTIEVAVKVIM